MLNYELELPLNMKIHPVFHINLLILLKTLATINRRESNPAPIKVDGQEEYKVEQILDSIPIPHSMERL